MKAVRIRCIAMPAGASRCAAWGAMSPTKPSGPTSVVGPLGFVGLIAPHAAQRLAPAGMAMHLILTAFIGALLVALADLVGRAAFAPVQLPAGLLTALIGVPLFVALLLRGRASASS